MKNIYFHHVGKGYHSLFDSILKHPPTGFTFDPKIQQGQLISKLYDNKNVRINLQYFNFFPLMHLLCESGYYLNNIYEKDYSNFDSILSAHRILNVKKIPWIVLIEYVGDLCPKIYDMKHIRFYKNYIEKSIASKSCKRVIPYLDIEKQTLFKFLNCERFKEKITTVRLSVQPKNFDKKYNKEKISILFMGTSNVSNIEHSFRERGGVEVLEAFKEINKRYSNTELIIRAKIPNDILVNYSKIINKSNVKIIEGVMPFNEFNSLMEKSDMLLFPGCITPSMTFIEAMSYEIPIIATNWRGNYEMISDNETGFLIKTPYRLNPIIPLNIKEKTMLFKKGLDKQVIKELIDKMSILIEEEKLRKKMGRRAKIEIDEGKFSIKRRNHQLKEIFDDAIFSPLK